MKLFKRFTGLILALSLVLSMGITASAEVSPDRDEMADFLNELTILRGDGTGYNFEGQLKRSEAATFIVRMLGMDKTVTDNPEDYSDNSFSDVEESDWFSAYVGYCVQAGIVGGFEDGTFRPNDYVSEKAFLKMLMTAMGYEYNEDFGWTDVYSYAYEINLVTDAIYRTKVNDNYSYTRGDVISALFDTLSAYKKGSDILMIQYFIDESIIDEQDVVDIGIKDDSVDTDIESLEVLDENTIVITFNEPMGSIEEEDIVVYEKDDDEQVLVIDDINADEDNIVFTIDFDDSQEPDVMYRLIMDELPDKYGNKSDMLSETFEGFRPEVIESNFFRISKVEAISNKTIYLYYTHPVNVNITQDSLYTLAEGSKILSSAGNSTITVSLLDSDDHAVIITLEEDTLEEDEDYELTVSGYATSQYSVTLNKGNGDSVTFEGIEKNDEPLEMLLAIAENDSIIELNFNKMINETIAEQVYSYYLTDSDDDPIQIMKATVTADGDVVNLMVNGELEDETEYKLMINRVNDATGQFEIIETLYRFTTDFKETSDVRIKDADSVDSNTIKVTLSRALDENYARKTSYWDIEGVDNTYSSVPIAIYYDPDVDPLTLKLFLAENKSLSKNKRYEVIMASKMLDANSRVQEETEKETFTHETGANNDVYIKKAIAVGESTLKLTFSKEIALDVPNVLNTNYQLSYELDDVAYTKIPISANYIDPLTMIVRFDQLDEAIDYEITFEALVDYAGIETDNSDGEYDEDVVWE